LSSSKLKSVLHGKVTARLIVGVGFVPLSVLRRGVTIVVRPNHTAHTYKLLARRIGSVVATLRLARLAGLRTGNRFLSGLNAKAMKSFERTLPTN
jgi:hypothetical protein